MMKARMPGGRAGRGRSRPWAQEWPAPFGAAAVLMCAVLTGLPSRADSLPPLLCIPSYAEPYEVAKPNVMMVPITGAGFRRISLGDCRQPAAVRWSPDHRSVLVAPSAGQPMFLCHFDPATRTFGYPQKIAAELGNPGVRYQVHISDFDWSHDGKRLVLANERRLVVLDLRTGHKQLIYQARSPRRTIDGVAWSPDGKRVAFSMPGRDLMGSNGSDVYKDLWLINGDGSGLRRLGRGMGASWSPDGSRLVAVDGGYGYGGGPAILSYRSTGGERRVLRAIKGRLVAGDVFGAVAYSPDGRYIAVLGPQAPAPSRNGELEPSLFLMDGAGRFVRTLVAEPKLGDISYSPRFPRLTW